jgi:SAM-dependent methyltransferase
MKRRRRDHVVFHDLECAYRVDEPSYMAEGKDVLELGAGTGRIALPMAIDGGKNVTALDYDQVLLAEMQSRFDRERCSVCEQPPHDDFVYLSEGHAYCTDIIHQASVKIVCADARQLRYSRRFDTVLATNQFLQLFHPVDRLAVMAGAAEALRPGGHLVATIHNPEDLEEARFDELPEPDVTRAHGRVYRSQPVDWWDEASRLYIERQRTVGRRVSREIVAYAVTSIDELEYDAAKVGLTLERSWRIAGDEQFIDATGLRFQRV